MTNIHFSSPITHQTSYGLCGLNLTEQLAKNSSVNLSISPIGGVSYDPFLLEQNLSHLHNKELFGDIISIVLFHQGLTSQYYHPKATKKVAFPIFELDNFNSAEINDLQQADEIIVCSQWAKNVLNQFIEKPIHVVPLGYNPKVFKFSKTHQNQFEARTVFLNIGKWEHRKCHTELAHLFRSAFSPLDNVLLLMCPHNFFLPPEENERLKNEYKKVLGDQVVFYDRLESQFELANVESLADCHIGLSHSEGFGLPNFESLVLGKEVILTDYAGHTEYANKNNSRLVSIDKLEPAVDGIWFKGQGRWAHIGQSQYEQTIQYMREIHKNTQANGHRNFESVHNSVKDFTWENAAKRLVDAI